MGYSSWSCKELDMTEQLTQLQQDARQLFQKTGHKEKSYYACQPSPKSLPNTLHCTALTKEKAFFLLNFEVLEDPEVKAFFLLRKPF